MQDDVQESDMRRGALGKSWHVTTKSSIRRRSALRKSGVYALKAVSFTPGGLQRVRSHAELRVERSALTALQESAEGIVGASRNWILRHSETERRSNGYAGSKGAVKAGTREWASTPGGQADAWH